MIVKVKRFLKKNNAILSKVLINDTEMCYCLEPADKAIPAGEYTVGTTYSNRFKREMPEILNVPNRTGIRIHSGNTADDSEGCQLYGYIKDEYKMFLGDSRRACLDFEQLLKIQMNKRCKIYITEEYTNEAIQ